MKHLTILLLLASTGGAQTNGAAAISDSLGNIHRAGFELCITVFEASRSCKAMSNLNVMAESMKFDAVISSNLLAMYNAGLHDAGEWDIAHLESIVITNTIVVTQECKRAHCDPPFPRMPQWSGPTNFNAPIWPATYVTQYVTSISCRVKEVKP